MAAPLELMPGSDRLLLVVDDCSCLDLVRTRFGIAVVVVAVIVARLGIAVRGMSCCMWFDSIAACFLCLELALAVCDK